MVIKVANFVKQIKKSIYIVNGNKHAKLNEKHESLDCRVDEASKTIISFDAISPLVSP